MTHTPGPWHVVEDTGEYMVDSLLHNIVVCSTHPPQHAANARLVAAAPELLMACEEALEHVLEGSTCHDFISAAIAKAKGE